MRWEQCFGGRLKRQASGQTWEEMEGRGVILKGCWNNTGKDKLTPACSWNKLESGVLYLWIFYQFLIVAEEMNTGSSLTAVDPALEGNESSTLY